MRTSSPLGGTSAHRFDHTGKGAGSALMTLLDSLRAAGHHDRVDGEPRATDERLWGPAHARLPHLIPAQANAAPDLLALIRRAYDLGYDDGST